MPVAPVVSEVLYLPKRGRGMFDSCEERGEHVFVANGSGPGGLNHHVEALNSHGCTRVWAI